MVADPRLMAVSRSDQPANQLAPPGKFIAALEQVRQAESKGIFVFHDLGPHARDPHAQRLLRDLQHLCPETKRTVVLIDSLPLPPDVRRLAVRYEIGWPDADELEEVVRQTYQRIRQESLHEVTSRITKREMEQLVQTLRGLTCAEAERVIASAIYQDYALRGDDIPRIVEAKRMLLGSTGCLESIAADFLPEDIGGLENLKSWLKQRRGGFTQQAREFGLEPPRGVLMLGVQGCGKSLCAKVVAADWKMPLLRLDPGVLYQKYIGESESRLRDALAQARGHGAGGVVDRRNRKGVRIGGGQRFVRRRIVAADVRHTAHMDAGSPPSHLPGGDGERHLAAAPRTDAQGPLRRNLFYRSAHGPGPAADPGDSPDPPRSRTRGIRFAGAGGGDRGLHRSGIGIGGAGQSLLRLRRECALCNRHILEQIGKTRPLSAIMPERIKQLRAWAKDRCVPAD